MRTIIRSMSVAVIVAASSITLPFTVPAAASAGQLAAAPAAAASLASILPGTATAGRNVNCNNPKKPCQSCNAILSVYEMTPAVLYVVSGQFPIFSGQEATAATCASASQHAYHAQYIAGWDPVTTCTRAINADDSILVYLTYVFGSNPSTRINGYGTICNVTTPVANVSPL